jgi:hypothetical protein
MRIYFVFALIIQISSAFVQTKYHAPCRIDAVKSLFNPQALVHKQAQTFNRKLRMAAEPNPRLDLASRVLNSYSFAAKKPSLLIGDTSVFLVFAAIGRMNHASTEGSILLTAAPYIISWFLFAPILNGYADANSRSQAVTSLVIPWAASIPSAVLLRGLIQGYVPATSFWVVSLVTTAILLASWRSAYFQVSVAATTVDKFVEAILEDDD